MPDSDADNQDISKQLQALQQSYASELPGKIDEIERHWQSLLSTGWNEDTVAEIHRKSHSLAGSGTSFGFPDVSHSARQLEIELKKILEFGALPDDDQQKIIEQRIAQLRTSIGNNITNTVVSNEEAAAVDTDQHLVLVLDTRQHIGEELARELSKFDYHTEQITDTESLYTRLSQVKPVAVIVCTHEGETAPRFTDTINGLTIPASVIFVSDSDSFENRLAAVRAGSNAFLSENTDVGQLIDKIDQLNTSEKKEPYRVLVIDDSDALASHYALILEQAGMMSEIVTDPLTIDDKLSSFRPELLLVDMYMPEYNGVELAKVLRQHEAYVGIPIVFLSAETNIEKQIDAMKEGGDDFLTKPIHPDHLISSIANRIERYRVLRAMMENDSLTGLLNHTRIKQRLDIEIARADREKHSLTFAMLDLDNFKQVNDTYGHAVGDQVLKMLSRVLRQRLRRTDIIGRYGGEEFAIILPDSTLSASETLMNTVRKVFAKLPIHADSTTFSLTFSCGLAAYPEYDTAASISEAADQALYGAKSAGKNCVVTSHMEKDN